MTGVIIENVRIAFGSIRSHLLRTVLTVLIIAFGIMALVGILTATDSLKYYLKANFMEMGANTFAIKNRSLRIHFGEGAKTKYYRPINLDEALAFKERFEFPAYTSVFTYASWISTAKYKENKTNPNVPVLGGDENYLITSGNRISMGRNFSATEVHSGDHVAIIGPEIRKTLFGENEDPIGKIISIGSGKYKVIGVLKEKGSAMGFSGDRNCLLPLNNVRQYFPNSTTAFTLNVMVNDQTYLDPAISEATGLFRIIRGLKVQEENNFDIAKSDNIAEMLIDNLSYISLAATIIGIITLIGAAVGLMNIMMVTVTERTREIGIRKAIGANRKIIRNQFLIEAVVIGQIGGLVGIVLGILAGNVVSLQIGGEFFIPWPWIISGILLCLAVALLSGFYPASKASKVDPIESLRYE